MFDSAGIGGEKILDVFEIKLKEAINKIPFQKILTLKNVQMVVNEADGYQPHIIAPENGYRRLIEDGLSQLREPALIAVEQVGSNMQHAQAAYTGRRLRQDDCRGWCARVLLQEGVPIAPADAHT